MAASQWGQEPLYTGTEERPPLEAVTKLRD
jgi:hypothetical protein